MQLLIRSLLCNSGMCLWMNFSPGVQKACYCVLGIIVRIRSNEMFDKQKLQVHSLSTLEKRYECTRGPLVMDTLIGRQSLALMYLEEVQKIITLLDKSVTEWEKCQTPKVQCDGYVHSALVHVCLAGDVCDVSMIKDENILQMLRPMVIDDLKPDTKVTSSFRKLVCDYIIRTQLGKNEASQN